MRIRLLDKGWELRFEKLPSDTDGECVPPHRKRTVLRVDCDLTGKDKLETILHEMLHAVDWYKDEEAWVKPVAEQMARALWRLGYRGPDD